MNENHSPVFSVIIPTYNREKLISRAIDSVLDQTFKDFELIIVDDGSIDDTKKVVEEYLRTDNRVQYIYKENGGQNSALNVGLKNANGFYASFLDSDDIWMPTKLEKVYEKFQSDSDIDVVYHSCAYSKGNGKFITANDDYLEGRIYKEVLEQEFLATQNAISVKRTCYEEVGYYDENFLRYQDDDICFTLAKKYKIGLVKETLSAWGGEADNRVSENPYRTAQYYLALIEKYKEDILQYCGNRKLSEMYYKAVIKWSRVKRKDEAWNALQNYHKYQNERRISKVRFEILYYYVIICSVLKKFKSRIWWVLIGRREACM